MQADNTDRKLVEQIIHESNVGPYAYDTALINDLRFRLKRPDGSNIVSDTIQFSGPDDDLRIQAYLNQDNVVLPFIALQRVGYSLAPDRQMDQTFNGGKVATYADEDNKIFYDIYAQAIPITINWRMRIYTADMITADALIREIIYYYKLHPTLMVNIPHGLNMKHNFNIYFNEEIENNSDIENFKSNGTIYRHDLSFYSDDAYLWKARWDYKVEIFPQFQFNYMANPYDTDATEEMNVPYYKYDKDRYKKRSAETINSDIDDEIIDEIIEKVSNYENLNNKPKINEVEVIGEKVSHDYGLQPEGDYPDTKITNKDIEDLINGD